MRHACANDYLILKPNNDPMCLPCGEFYITSLRNFIKLFIKNATDILSLRDIRNFDIPITLTSNCSYFIS